MKNVVIASAARTAIGDFGGALKDMSPIDLGVLTAKAAIERAGVAPENVGQAFYGNVIHTEARDMYVSRCISVGAGLPHSSPALTVNRLCGSGLQAVVSGVQTLALGDAEIVLAGGTECMSRSGYMMPAARWGQKMGDTLSVDMMAGVLIDPFGHGHMGVTAENIAAERDIDRETQDAFAVESHHRAARAIAAGYFDEQIVPVEIATRKGVLVFEKDEHVRPEATLEELSRLRPAFQKDGTVTAGNASGINDGSASLVLMSDDAVQSHNIQPMARVLSYGVSGVDPRVMGLGPVPAMQLALERADLSVKDLDVVESNEAFAAQACAVTSILGLDPSKVNPNGGAVALGHPIGASGAIILTKLLYELHRRGGGRGAATMCIGGGQGISVVVEV